MAMTTRGAPCKAATIQKKQVSYLPSAFTDYDSKGQGVNYEAIQLQSLGEQWISAICHTSWQSAKKGGHVIHSNSSKSFTKCTYVGPSLYHVLLTYYLYQASKNIYG